VPLFPPQRVFKSRRKGLIGHHFRFLAELRQSIYAILLPFQDEEDKVMLASEAWDYRSVMFLKPHGAFVENPKGISPAPSEFVFNDV
jgi:hypothetical protein